MKRIRAWGNVYAVPISKKEAREMGLRPGDQVDVDVRPHGRGLDVSKIPKLPLASHAQDLDDVAERAAAEPGD